jgi:hypothetical protein
MEEQTETEFSIDPCRGVISGTMLKLSSVVGYVAEGQDVSGGQCEDPLLGND